MGISPVLDEKTFQMFWRHSKDISGLFPNYFEFFACLSVFQLIFFLTEIKFIQGYLQFCMLYLSEIFWRHSWDGCTLVPNNSEFLVCLSVSQLAYFLTDIRQIQGYLQFCMIYLSEFFWRHSWDVCTLVPNNSEILVCLSVCYLAYFLTEITQIQITPVLDEISF